MSKVIHTPIFPWLTEDFRNSQVLDDPFYKDCIMLCFGENKTDLKSIHSINYIAYQFNRDDSTNSAAINIPFDTHFLKPILGKSNGFILNKNDFPIAEKKNWERILPKHEKAYAYYLGALTFPAAIILKPCNEILSLEDYTEKAHTLSLYSVSRLINHFKNLIDQSSINQHKDRISSVSYTHLTLPTIYSV